MQSFHPTIILRHCRENLKKCSLRGLEGRSDFQFYSYPLSQALPDLKQYVVLSLDGAPLSEKDTGCGLFIVDGTWRYAKKMEAFLERENLHLEKRSLPLPFVTAYPRVQNDCEDPERGLASIEALFVALHLLGRSTEGLLDHYYWKELFLEQNHHLL